MSSSLHSDRVCGGSTLVASTIAMLEQKLQTTHQPPPPIRRRFLPPPSTSSSINKKSNELSSNNNNNSSQLISNKSPDLVPKQLSCTIIETIPKRDQNRQSHMLLYVDENDCNDDKLIRDTMSTSSPPPTFGDQIQKVTDLDHNSDSNSGAVRPLSSSSDGTECSETVVCDIDDDDSSDNNSCTTSDASTSDDSSSSSSSSSSGKEFVLIHQNSSVNSASVTNANSRRDLEPITEEDRPLTGTSIQTLDEEQDDSTCCDEDFQWISSNNNKQSEEKPNQSFNFNMVTTKPPTPNQSSNKQLVSNRSRIGDSSPRRQIERSTPPNNNSGGSLDRRRSHNHNRQDRDIKSKSLKDYHQRQSPIHNEREFHFPPPPPRCELYQNTQLDPSNQSFVWNYENERYYHHHTPPYSSDYDCYHKRYGSSSTLAEQQQQSIRLMSSQPDLYNQERDRQSSVAVSGPSHSWRCLYPHHNRSDMCCTYHTLPPPPHCCHHCYDSNDMLRGSSYNNPPPWNNFYKGSDQDEKIKKLENDKDHLQMQVQVLSEQIEAQSDKIADLEKILLEKKQLLGNAEDLLQREMLSRSSLETQKLELMSAMSELKLQQAALERENIELRTGHYTTINGNPVMVSGGNIKKPPLHTIRRTSPIPQQTSTPIHPTSQQLITSNQSPSPSPILANSSGGITTRIDDNYQSKTPPPNYRRTVDIHYGSLPRQTYTMQSSNNCLMDNNANNSSQTNLTTVAGGLPNSASVPSRKGVAFGKGISSLLGGARNRGQSVPNLAETEKVVIDDTTDGATSFSPQASPSMQINKNKGIKKIFGKMKRSGSGNLDDLPGDGEFKRGGVRATAGPRLCWNQPHETKRPDKPFHEWDTDVLCDWLQELGLDAYLTDAKRWIKNGAQLQSASTHELEKELGIKNSLHRKKLQLAVLDMTDNGTSDTQLKTAGKLDTAWVLRWLDDTGLPQHKDAFLQARIDGRLLHRLTLDDLAALHITSLLHATSIRRGIQVLREYNFDPGCLIRRSLPDEQKQPEAKDVALWTAHRVMEWLRVVDLAEYAPNLRGAGVHGALMVYEPKFTAELMATLLNIPPSKTLLRRHLSTHFKELLGKEIIQEKREAETVLGFVPLTPATKLKIVKKSQFSLKRKKSKGEMDYGDLVCPLRNESSNQSGETTTNINGTTSIHRDASSGMMKKTIGEKDMAVYHLVNENGGTDDVIHAHKSSPLPQRLKDSILV